MFEKRLLSNKKQYYRFFIGVFFVSNFNALLQVYISRMLYTAIYSVCLLAILVYDLIKKQFKVSVSKVGIPIFLYATWIIMRFTFQFVFGNTTSLSIISFAQTLIPVLVYFIAFKMQNDDSVKCEKWFVVFALISALLGFMNQVFNIIPNSNFINELVKVEGHIYNRFYSMSGLSLGTGWMCGVAIALLLSSGNRIMKSKVIKILAYVIFVVSDLLTFSRGGVFFALIIYIIWLFSQFFMKRKEFSKNRMMVLVVIIFVGMTLALIYSGRITSSALFRRYVYSAFDGATSLRAGFQGQAINLIKKYPIAGKGFGFVGSNAYLNGIGDGFPPESNYYLILINSGFIGLIFFLISTLEPVIKCLKKFSNERILVYVGIIIGALAWNLMSTPLEGDLSAMLFWYCVGRINHNLFVEDTYSFNVRMKEFVKENSV